MNKQNPRTIYFAILSIVFVSKLLEIVSPAIQSIGMALNVPYTSLMLIMTIPVLVSIPVTLLVGFITGNIFRYRTVLSFGLLLMAVAGMAPFFLREWTLILVARGLFGVGQGIIMPIVLALIFRLVATEKQATLMGMQNVVAGVAGMVFSFASGILASMSWTYPFLLNAVTIVSFIIVLIFLPEPAKQEKPAGLPDQALPDQALPKPSGGIPAGFWVYVIIMFVFSVLNFPSMGNISIVLDELGMSPAMAGTALMLMTCGTLVAGLIFGAVFKRIGLKTIALGFFASCIAQLLMATGTVFASFAIGMFLVGFGGLGMAFAGLFMASGKSVGPEKSSVVMSITMTGMNVGLFISPFIFSAVMMAVGIPSMRLPYWIALVGFAVLGVIGLLVKQAAPKGLAQAPDGGEATEA